MMRMVGEVAVAIGSSLALSLIVKATVISAGALIAAHVARRSRASVRHILLAAAFILLLALPLVSVATPPREVSVSVPLAGSTVRVTTPAPVRTVVPDSRSVDNDGLRAGSVTGTLPPASRLLLAVWVMGVALVLVPTFAGLMRVRLVRQNGLPWRDGQAVVGEITAARAVRIRAQLLLDETVGGPMTCGVLRPVIVLPREARMWDAEDLQRAIVHELEHIRRRDWLMLLIARVVCALYWFHPLVWISWRQLRLEAEKACDDAVLRGAHPEVALPAGVRLDRPLCGLMLRPGVLMAGAMTMGEFARELAPQVNRFVLDRTGITGFFDFDVQFTPEQMTPPPPGVPLLPPVDPNGPSLFTALQEQLGIRLNATRGPIEVLVIDAISRPTPD